jgi:hypothetical protein
LTYDICSSFFCKLVKRRPRLASSPILLERAPDRLGYRGVVAPAGTFGELTVRHHGILFCEQEDHVSAPVSPTISVLLPTLALVHADQLDNVCKWQSLGNFLEAWLFARIAFDPRADLFQELLASKDESALHFFERGLLITRADRFLHIAPVVASLGSDL